MKKTGLLNQPLSAVIAGLGHTDMLVIGDAGLPIPAGPQRIDLAVSAGVPPFLEVVRAVLGEMAVQGAIVATEMASVSPAMHAALRDILGDIPVEVVPHEVFKARTREARAIVRTGEFTPYANVILIAGVVF
ncbi:MAG: D-ribose pyranase [Anaerolineae bacterium]|nr:D-ribose pyranase [Anaerolineae bacterium]